jgi:hypothetical protein
MPTHSTEGERSPSLTLMSEIGMGGVRSGMIAALLSGAIAMATSFGMLAGSIAPVLRRRSSRGLAPPPGSVHSLCMKSLPKLPPPSLKVSIPVRAALTDSALYSWSCTWDLVVRPATSIACRRSFISTCRAPLTRPSRTTSARKLLDVIFMLMIMDAVLLNSLLNAGHQHEVEGLFWSDVHDTLETADEVHGHRTIFLKFRGFRRVVKDCLCPVDH